MLGAASRKRASRRKTTNPSGQAMPADNRTGWTRVLAEDFNTPVAIGGWPANGNAAAGYPAWRNYQDGWQGSTLVGHYRPQLVLSCHDGMLDWYFHSPTSGDPAFAAPLLDVATYAQTYGRYECILRLPDTMPGYKSAFLAWPTSETWPRDGENDFPEGDFDGTLGGYIHLQGATVGGDQEACETDVPFDDGLWHYCVTEWMPGFVRYTLDGVVIGATAIRAPNTEMRWTLQTETSFSGAPADVTEGHLLCDWAVQYDRAIGAWDCPWVSGVSGVTPSLETSTLVLDAPREANLNDGTTEVQTGDLLVAFVAAYGAATLSAAGWTQIGSTVTVGGDRTAQVFYRYHDGSDTYTFTASAATFPEGVLMAIRGAAATSPIRDNDVAQNTGTTITAPSVDATDYDLLLNLVARYDGGTYFEPRAPLGMGHMHQQYNLHASAEPVVPGATGTRTMSGLPSDARIVFPILIKAA